MGVRVILRLVVNCWTVWRVAEHYVEPAHGSAPDIAGRNEANPYSMIGSIALLLEKLLGLDEEGLAVWNALFSVYEAGYVTADLADSSTRSDHILGTAAFGDAVDSTLAASGG